MWQGQPRVRLATLPTHLERGPILAGQSQLWVKRDDLTGLGMGGNKARKLEFLCGAAVAAGADCLITVGAGQSNHCRMTAAAGAMLGLEVHLVLAGDRPKVLEGNQLLSERFGAHQHFTGAGPSEWGLLEIAREDLTEELSAQGLKPYSIPIGGSTAVGALGYIVAYQEIVEQAEIQVKYSGYIEKEKSHADKLTRLEDVIIPENFNFDKIQSISIEAKQKLNKIRPRTIAQASRISGVSPSDVSVLLIYMGR